MVLMVPLLIMATSLVSKINTSVAFLKGWVNSFLAFMGQLYLGFYSRQTRDRKPRQKDTWGRRDNLEYTAGKSHGHSDAPTEGVSPQTTSAHLHPKQPWQQASTEYP